MIYFLNHTRTLSNLSPILLYPVTSFSVYFCFHRLLFETIISDQLWSFPKHKRLLSNGHYGFRQRRSTGDQLPLVSHSCPAKLDNHTWSRSISLRLSIWFAIKSHWWSDSWLGSLQFPYRGHQVSLLSEPAPLMLVGMYPSYSLRFCTRTHSLSYQRLSIQYIHSIPFLRQLFHLSLFTFLSGSSAWKRQRGSRPRCLKCVAEFWSWANPLLGFPWSCWLQCYGNVSSFYFHQISFIQSSSIFRIGPSTLHTSCLFSLFNYDVSIILVSFHISASLLCCAQSWFSISHQMLHYSYQHFCITSRPHPSRITILGHVMGGASSIWSGSTQDHLPDKWLFLSMQPAVSS